MVVGTCLVAFYLLWVIYFVHLSNYKGRKLESTLKEVFKYTALLTCGGFIATLYVFMIGRHDALVIGYLFALGGICIASTIAMVVCMFCGENKEDTMRRIAKARLGGKKYDLILDNTTLIDRCRSAYSYALAELLVVEKQVMALEMNKKHSCSFSDTSKLEEKDAKTLVKCLKLRDTADAMTELGKLRLALDCSVNVRKAVQNLEESLKSQVDERISKYLDMNDIAFELCEISKYDMEIVETVRVMFEYTDVDSNEKKQLIVAIGVDDVKRMAAELINKKHG